MDLMELCEAIRRGMPHFRLLEMVGMVDRRQRRRFGERERRLSVVQYRDSDEESNYDNLPALETASGQTSPVLLAVGDREDPTDLDLDGDGETEPVD